RPLSPATLTALSSSSTFFSLVIPRPPISTLFPYTTLFRSNLHLGSPSAVAKIRKDLAKRSAPWLHKAAKAMSEATLADWEQWRQDRKSTRLNSSHGSISYAVFCLKKKKQKKQT